MKNKYVFVGCLLTTLFFLSLGVASLFAKKTEQKDGAGFTVVTSFYPVYIAALNVAGDVDGVTVRNLSEPQTGCLHDFQLTPEDLKLLSRADVFLINGGGIESFMQDVAQAYPELFVLNASQDIQLLGETGQKDGPREDERHGVDEEVNAHAWMSISDYRTMVGTIEKGLAARDKRHADAYRSNAKDYDAKLEELEAGQRKIEKRLGGQSVVLFHEAYAYIARDLGLCVSATLDMDEERQVSAGEISDLLVAMERDDARYILAEERFGRRLAERVTAEKGQVKVIYLEPLTRGKYEKDAYLKGMRENISRLQEMIE